MLLLGVLHSTITAGLWLTWLYMPENEPRANSLKWMRRFLVDRRVLVPDRSTKKHLRPAAIYFLYKRSLLFYDNEKVKTEHCHSYSNLMSRMQKNAELEM